MVDYLLLDECSTYEQWPANARLVYWLQNLNHLTNFTRRSPFQSIPVGKGMKKTVLSYVD